MIIVKSSLPSQLEEDTLQQWLQVLPKLQAEISEKRNSSNVEANGRLVLNGENFIFR